MPPSFLRIIDIFLQKGTVICSPNRRQYFSLLNITKFKMQISCRFCVDANVSKHVNIFNNYTLLSFVKSKKEILIVKI